MIWIAVLLSLCFPIALQAQSRWAQPPGFIVETNAPNNLGGTRPSNFIWRAPGEPTNAAVAYPIVADDFVADEYFPVLRVRWWGSYLNGHSPSLQTNFFEDGFALSFLAHFSGQAEPHMVLATYLAPMESITVSPTSFAGADGLPIFEYEIRLDQTCLDYRASDHAEAAAFKGSPGRRYWLAIQSYVGRQVRRSTNAMGDPIWTGEFTSAQVTNDSWGWHTSPAGGGLASVSGELKVHGTNLNYLAASWQTNGVVSDELDQAFELSNDCESDRPSILAVEAHCPENIIKVVFSERMDANDIADGFNYVLESYDGSYVWVEPDLQTVWLTFESFPPFPCAEPFRFWVSYVRDACGNIVMGAETWITLQCSPCARPGLEEAWSQQPASIIDTNTLTPGGTVTSNVQFTNAPGITNHIAFSQVVADDFRSDGQPISTVRFWGSYLLNAVPSTENGFVLSFFSDSEIGAFHHPSNLLATYLTRRIPAVPIGQSDSSNRAIYQYEVDLADSWLFQRQGQEAQPYSFLPMSNTVYWISIGAQLGIVNTPVLQTGWLSYSSGGRLTNHFWGWHTSPIHREASSITGSTRKEGATFAYDLDQPLPNESSQAFELLASPGECNPVKLEPQRVGSRIIFSWADADYVLEASPNPNGPWHFASSIPPFLVHAAETHLFFRLACRY